MLNIICIIQRISYQDNELLKCYFLLKNLFKYMTRIQHFLRKPENAPNAILRIQHCLIFDLKGRRAYKNKT